MLVLGVSTLTTRGERLGHRILEVNEYFTPFLSHVRINGILTQPTIWTPGHNEDMPPRQALEGGWRPRGKAPLARPVGGHRSCKVDCERGGCCQSSVRDRGSQTLPSTSLRGYSRTRKSGYTDPRFRDSDTLSEEEKNRKKRSSCI